MSRRRRAPKAARRAGRTPRRSRRLARAAGLLAGTLLAAGGGWLYAATSRTPADHAARPEATTRPSRPPGTLPPFARAMAAPAASDLTVRGDQLQVPVVDFTEILPSCHN